MSVLRRCESALARDVRAEHITPPTFLLRVGDRFLMLGKIRLPYEASEEEIIMSAGYFKDPDAIARLSDE